MSGRGVEKSVLIGITFPQHVGVSWEVVAEDVRADAARGTALACSAYVQIRSE